MNGNRITRLILTIICVLLFLAFVFYGLYELIDITQYDAYSAVLISQILMSLALVSVLVWNVLVSHKIETRYRVPIIFSTVIFEFIFLIYDFIGIAKIKEPLFIFLTLGLFALYAVCVVPSILLINRR